MEYETDETTAAADAADETSEVDDGLGDGVKHIDPICPP